MSDVESKDSNAPESPDPAAEDERRARAAEINRKRTEDEWNRNKKSWLKENFPEKKEA
ncbi:MAG: hypothetical protein ACRD16_03470 [Thermoanaerobaculia bacterium]